MFCSKTIKDRNVCHKTFSAISLLSGCLAYNLINTGAQKMCCKLQKLVGQLDLSPSAQMAKKFRDLVRQIVAQ